MSDPKFQTEPIRETLQIVFEQILVGTVAAAAIAQQAHGSGGGIQALSVLSPPPFQTVAGELTGIVTATQVDITGVSAQVVQTVRNHTTQCITGKIMVKGQQGLARVNLAIAVEGTEQLPLFRVDAQDRIERVKILPFDPCDILELGVAIRMRAHVQVLEHLPTMITLVVEQLADNMRADIHVAFPQGVLNVPRRKVGPDHLGTHRVTRRVILQHPPELGYQFRKGFYDRQATTPFFRTRVLGPMSAGSWVWSC